MRWRASLWKLGEGVKKKNRIKKIILTVQGEIKPVFR